MRNDAFQELEEVLPALRAAEEALNALNKGDIIEIKTFTKPPNLVQLTLEGVCGLLGEKADWDTARRVRHAEGPYDVPLAAMALTSPSAAKRTLPIAGALGR